LQNFGQSTKGNLKSFQFSFLSQRVSHFDGSRIKVFSPVCEQEFLNEKLPAIYLMPREMNMNQDALRDGFSMSSALIYHSKFVRPLIDGFCVEVQKEIVDCVENFQRVFQDQIRALMT
jgi:hypothetical protein